MPQKKINFTKRELELIDTACWHLFQVLDGSRATWTGAKYLQAQNQKDMKDLAGIRSKIKTGA